MRKWPRIDDDYDLNKLGVVLSELLEDSREKLQRMIEIKKSKREQVENLGLHLDQTPQLRELRVV